MDDQEKLRDQTSAKKTGKRCYEKSLFKDRHKLPGGSGESPSLKHRKRMYLTGMIQLELIMHWERE